MAAHRRLDRHRDNLCGAHFIFVFNLAHYTLALNATTFSVFAVGAIFPVSLRFGAFLDIGGQWQISTHLLCETVMQ
jgi:hypothetical protein